MNKDLMIEICKVSHRGMGPLIDFVEVLIDRVRKEARKRAYSEGWEDGARLGTYEKVEDLNEEDLSRDAPETGGL